MRTVVLSVAAAGLLAGGGAHAQTSPATQAPAPAAAPPVAPPAAAAPATTAPEAAPAPEAPQPTLPTSGDGAAVISLLEKICVPMVRGQKLDDLAKANGFKLNKREGVWVAPMAAKPYSMTVLPQGSNKDLCQAEIHFAVGQEQPIVSAINIWSFLHQPELILQANYVAVDADGVKRVRKSWEHFGSNQSIAVNFTTERNPDGSPLGRGYDVGRLFYQVRSF